MISKNRRSGFTTPSRMSGTPCRSAGHSPARPASTPADGPAGWSPDGRPFPVAAGHPPGPSLTGRHRSSPQRPMRSSASSGVCGCSKSSRASASRIGSSPRREGNSASNTMSENPGPRPAPVRPASSIPGAGVAGPRRRPTESHEPGSCEHCQDVVEPIGSDLPRSRIRESPGQALDTRRGREPQHAPLKSAPVGPW